MSEPRSESVAFSWPVLLVVVALAGGYFSLEHPLESKRPTVQRAFDRPLIEDEIVHSRLWQDPFRTTLAHEEVHGQHQDQLHHPPSRETEPDSRSSESHQHAHGSKPVPGHILSTVKAQIERPAEGSRPIQVVAAMVSGAPYAEAHERRLTSRYAIVSALNLVDYHPVNAENINYFDLHWPAKGRNIATNIPPEPMPDRSLRVPYEWFKRSSPGGGKTTTGESDRADSQVLVLWLKNGAFSDSPLSRMAYLFHHLLRQSCFEVEGYKSAPIHVFGPSRSTTLRAMIEQAHKIKDHPAWEEIIEPIFGELSIYSSWATASKSRLRSGLATSRSEEDFTSGPCEPSLFEGTPVDFERSVNSDSDLADTLIRELERRGVRYRSKHDHVALISEWDTFYGNALPRTFRERLAAWLEDDSRSQENSMAKNTGVNDNLVSNRVHRFTYLRGIDGVVQNSGRGTGYAATRSSGGKRTGANGADPSTIESSSDQGNTPTGRSQLDYLLRLAKRMKHTEGELNGRFKAIGILGSDVYDKLLLLQALRPYFSNAIFFTTDLDARLFAESQLRWTRNLIVASSFGLSLHKDYQDRIPPFRNGYQTALFSAVLSAFSSKENKPLLGRPRIFEIGRGGPHDLTPSLAVGAEPNSSGPKNHLHPERDDEVSLGGTFFVLIRGLSILALFVSIFFCLVRPNWIRESALNSQEIRRKSLAATLVLASILLTLLLVSWLAELGYQNGYGEPWSLVEGISIWPTELLRLIALLGSIFFIWRVGKDLSRNSQSIQDAFGIAMVPKEQTSRRTGRSELKQVWNEYVLREAYPSRRMRVTVLVAIFVLIWCLLSLWLDREFVPTRGSVSYLADLAIRHLSVLGWMLLTAVTVDVTFQCGQLIREFNRRDLKWPSRMKKRFMGHAGGRKYDAEAEKKAFSVLDDDWLSMLLLARRSEVVGRIILYPFCVLFFLVVARVDFLDAWTWPWSSMIGIALAVLLLVGLGSWLRIEAERFRDRATRHLEEQLLVRLTESRHADSSQEEALRSLPTSLARLGSLRRGAFSPFSRNPVLVGLLFPFGGLGGVVVLEQVLRHIFLN